MVRGALFVIFSYDFEPVFISGKNSYCFVLFIVLFSKYHFVFSVMMFVAICWFLWGSWLLCLAELFHATVQSMQVATIFVMSCLFYFSETSYAFKIV